MSRLKLKQGVNDDQDSQVDDAVDYDDREEALLQQASADLYERRWRTRTKNHQANLWVVGAVYLILASIAFVVI